MAERVPVADFRKRISAILDGIERRKVYIVTRYGQDLAILGPAQGSNAALLAAAEDCARTLRETEAKLDAGLAEILRLRNRAVELEEELRAARELNEELRNSKAKRGWR